MHSHNDNRAKDIRDLKRSVKRVRQKQVKKARHEDKTHLRELSGQDHDALEKFEDEWEEHERRKR